MAGRDVSFGLNSTSRIRIVPGPILEQFPDFAGAVNIDMKLACSRARETAPGQVFGGWGASDIKNCAISALSAAQRGPWGPHRPIVRAGAAACGVELAAARALSASARVHVIHDQFLARVLSGTRPE